MAAGQGDAVPARLAWLSAGFALLKPDGAPRFSLMREPTTFPGVLGWPFGFRQAEATQRAIALGMTEAEADATMVWLHEAMADGRWRFVSLFETLDAAAEARALSAALEDWEIVEVSLAYEDAEVFCVRFQSINEEESVVAWLNRLQPARSDAQVLGFEIIAARSVPWGEPWHHLHADDADRQASDELGFEVDPSRLVPTHTHAMALCAWLSTPGNAGFDHWHFVPWRLARVEVACG